MKLSRASDYSVRILVQLAKVRDKATNASLAKELRIAPAYLVKLVRELARRRLVRTIKGKGGGVEILQDPKKITLLDVVELNEGPLVLSDCLFDAKYCDQSASCGLKIKIAVVQRELKRILGKTTIADLIDKRR